MRSVRSMECGRFANATQRGRCGYGGVANTVRNREMKGGG